MSREIKLINELCGKLGYQVVGDRIVDIAQYSVLLPKEVFDAVSMFTINHTEDIESGINDFGELKILLDWFSRNAHRADDEGGA